MHLIDGSLPLLHNAAYGAISAGAVALGIRQYYKNSSGSYQYKIVSGIFTAFVFMSTVFEFPMPFGSSEHPTGTPLVSIFMGPLVTAFLSSVVLVLELFLREGGLTTLGANVLSLGIAGGFAGWGVFYGLRKFKLGLFICAFLAGFIGDICVYAVTAAQLAAGGMDSKSFMYYFLAFVPGQVPLAVIEGLFTGFVIKFIYERRNEFLKEFGVIGG
ncbi:MAG: energy-coupling factor ABC transporter permease [Bacillota bacterium]